MPSWRHEEFCAKKYGLGKDSFCDFDRSRFAVVPKTLMDATIPVDLLDLKACLDQ